MVLSHLKDELRNTLCLYKFLYKCQFSIWKLGHWHFVWTNCMVLYDLVKISMEARAIKLQLNLFI